MTSAPPPIQDAIARVKRDRFGDRSDPQAGMVTDPWIEFFNQLSSVVDDAPATINSVSLTAQAASIGATDMTDGTINGGLYRVSYYARITRAATTSSSLTVTLGWTEGSVSPTFVGAAITGNTTTTVQSGTIMIRVDANAPITYSTTYASVGATTMQYSLTLTLERLPT